MNCNADNKKQKGPRIQRTAMPNTSSSKSNQIAGKDEQLLKVLQKHSNEIILIITEEGMIKYSNPASKNILGYDPFRLVGNNVRKIIPVKQWVAFKAALRASDEKAEQRVSIDCQLIDSDDKRQFFSITVMDYRLHAQVEGYIIYAMKIDRLKRQDAKLKLRNLAIELIKEAVVIIDPKRKAFLFANKAFYEMSGFTPQEIMGGKLNLFRLPYSDMLFDEQTSPKMKERFYRAIKNQKKFDGRIYSRRKNGSIFYNKFSLFPVHNAENLLTHYIVSLKEIKPRIRRANL